MGRTKAEDKRIRDELFSQFKDEFTHFGVRKARANRVEIRFARYTEVFKRSPEGELYRLYNGLQLDQFDYDVLARLSYNVMKAVEAGYTPQSETIRRQTRKKAYKDSNPRYTNKKRSQSALEQARAAHLYNLYMSNVDGVRDCHIEVLTGTSANIRYKGIHTRFTSVAHTKRVRLEPSGEYIKSTATYAFLCCFAENLVRATFNGYMQIGRKKSPNTEFQYRLPFFDKPSYNE